MPHITDNIIADLLPLYYSKHASKDTISLVENYFSENPKFAVEHQTPIVLPTPNLEKPDELNVLKKTRFYLMMRSLLLYLAIFTSFAPFAFGDVSWIEEKGIHWLWKDTPEVAVLSGVVAVVCWLLYAMLRKNLRVTEL